jgi:AraC-like DNA-binding protein
VSILNEFVNDLLGGNKLFEIEYRKVKDKGSMPSNHYHNHYEIYYQLSGERYYFIKDRSYYVKKGDLVLINMFDLHKTSHAGCSEYERILINFNDMYLQDSLDIIRDIDLLQAFRRDFNIYRLSLPDQTFVEKLLGKMLTESDEIRSGSRTYLKISLIELLIFISRQPDKPQYQYLEHPSALHRKISDVARYININFRNKLTLKELAGQFGVSPFYLSRTFKNVTGFSLVEYLNITRIREAQKLLVLTELSVTKIADAVGFDSSTHFGRVFKAIHQISPLKYKKINRENFPRP